MLNSITITYEITFPNKPISHNATSVKEDGKTLTWNLNASSNTNPEFEFAFKKAESTSSTTTKTKTSFISNIFSNFSFDKETIIALSLIGGGILTIIITLVVNAKMKKNN